MPEERHTCFFCSEILPAVVSVEYMPGQHAFVCEECSLDCVSFAVMQFVKQAYAPRQTFIPKKTPKTPTD